MNIPTIGDVVYLDIDPFVRGIITDIVMGFVFINGTPTSYEIYAWKKASTQIVVERRENATVLRDGYKIIFSLIH